MAKKVLEADATDRELVITRLIHAPRTLVFEVWTDPEHIRHWWGPDGFSNTISKMEVRPEGVWEFVMHGPDGVDYKNKCIFTEVVKPERLAYSHVSGPTFNVVVTFEEQEGKTLLTMRMTFDTGEQRNKVVRQFKADEGLKQNINRLKEYLATRFKDREMNFTRFFNAPRTLVFELWTKAEHITKWWGPNGFTTTTHEMNVKPGGVWRFIMHGPDGVDYPNRIEYKEVIKPERLVFDHGSDDDPKQFEVTVLFNERGNKTELNMRMVFRSRDERNMVIEKFGAIEGNKQTMNRLAVYLETFAS